MDLYEQLEKKSYVFAEGIHCLKQAASMSRGPCKCFWIDFSYRKITSLQTYTGQPILSFFCQNHYTCVLSHVQLFATPLTVACQSSLSMKFFRQEYWSCHFRIGISYSRRSSRPRDWTHVSCISCIDRHVSFFFFTTEPPKSLWPLLLSALFLNKCWKLN